jgi:hypothetical protein
MVNWQVRKLVLPPHPAICPGKYGGLSPLLSINQ